MKIGAQVRLAHGRGTGIVISSEGGESSVFVGRRQDTSPIIDVYVDCELAATGREFVTIAKLVAEELNEPKSKGNWSSFAVTGS
jgi:hypothetical protein